MDRFRGGFDGARKCLYRAQLLRPASVSNLPAGILSQWAAKRRRPGRPEGQGGAPRIRLSPPNQATGRTFFSNCPGASTCSRIAPSCTSAQVPRTLTFGEHALEITDAGGQGLHFAEAFVDGFKPVADQLKGFAKPLFKRR